MGLIINLPRIWMLLYHVVLTILLCLGIATSNEEWKDVEIVLATLGIAWGVTILLMILVLPLDGDK